MVDLKKQQQKDSVTINVYTKVHNGLTEFQKFNVELKSKSRS